MRRLIVISAVFAMACAVFTACGSTDDVKSGFMGELTRYGTETLTKKGTESVEPSKTTKKYDTSGDRSGDEHFIQPDDYFVSKNAYTTQTWIHVHLAKMKTAPTPQTKGEAEFFQVRDAKEYWTKYFWKTRIATSADIKLGQVVVMLDYAQGDVYIPPKDKDSARTDNWFMAKITDTSDLYKGYVTVSGGYKVVVDGLRVPLK